jgi:hypothetical protein
MKGFSHIIISFFLLAGFGNLQAQDSPYPPSPVIKGVEFDWSTHIRRAPGSDNWPVTWADDDLQYTVWGDGGGFGGTNNMGRSSIGVASIEGSWNDFKAQNIWGGFNSPVCHNITGKSYGIICIDSILYMWLGMMETEKEPFGEVKIAWSQDHGRSWQFTDWTFTKKQGLMMPTFCNYGKNYEEANNEYVYSYFIRFQSYEGPDNYEDKANYLNCQKPGIIYLARVPVDQIRDCKAYTFFAGIKNDKPRWTRDINEKLPVFRNEKGVGWCMSVIYNRGIERYLLVTEHNETHRGNISIFDAPDPWGPWTTVLYQTDWGKGYIPLNTFYWNFSNRWTSKDGENFSLIFSGRKENDSFNMIRGKFIK